MQPTAARQSSQVSSHACRSAAVTETALQTPHGDKLQNLMLSDDKKQAAIDSCTQSLECSDRNACDVELLIVGCVSWCAEGSVCCVMLTQRLLSL